MRIRQSFILLYFALPFCVTGIYYSLANVDFWVPEELIEKADKEYSHKAGQRIQQWREVLQQASSMSEKNQLTLINEFFNKNIAFRDDESHWQQIDYWATPYESLGSSGGDCEDYVIAKYYSLIKLGVDTTKLRITYVQAVKLKQAHMVLAYFPTPDSIPLVLDNLIAPIIPADKRTDLRPVYSFNANGMWLEKMKGKGVLMGNPNKLDLWTDLRIRMSTLGMDI